MILRGELQLQTDIHTHTIGQPPPSKSTLSTEMIRVNTVVYNFFSLELIILLEYDLMCDS